MFDIVAIGRAGVDLYSLDYGVPLEEARRFARYVGGTTANTVVGGARLGLNCALVTRVSDDELGTFVVNFLEKEGVDVSHVTKDGRKKTGIVFAEVLPGKDGRFIFYRENVADLGVTAGDVGDLFRRTRAMIITGTGLSAEPSHGTVVKAARKTRKEGKEVVLNLDWRPSLWKCSETKRVARYMHAMAESSIVVGNDKEFMAATGTGDIRTALAAVPDKAVTTVVITRGERGSEVISGGEVYRAEGFRVHLVKGLGGGDGFLAGFLYGNLRGWGPDRAATFGNAVGAIVVTGHACSESMPRLPRVVSFLRSKGYDFDPKTGPFKH